MGRKGRGFVWERCVLRDLDYQANIIHRNEDGGRMGTEKREIR